MFEDTWRRGHDKSIVFIFEYRRKIKVEAQHFKGKNKEAWLYLTKDHSSNEAGVDHYIIPKDGQWHRVPIETDYLAISTHALHDGDEPDAGYVRLIP